MTEPTSGGGPPDGRRDVSRAVRQLAERLPALLSPLAGLAFNYW